MRISRLLIKSAHEIFMLAIDLSGRYRGPIQAACRVQDTECPGYKGNKYTRHQTPESARQHGISGMKFSNTN